MAQKAIGYIMVKNRILGPYRGKGSECAISRKVDFINITAAAKHLIYSGVNYGEKLDQSRVCFENARELDLYTPLTFEARLASALVSAHRSFPKPPIQFLTCSTGQLTRRA